MDTAKEEWDMLYKKPGASWLDETPDREKEGKVVKAIYYLLQL